MAFGPFALRFTSTILSNLIYYSSQDVFEYRYAKMPANADLSGSSGFGLGGTGSGNPEIDMVEAELKVLNEWMRNVNDLHSEVLSQLSPHTFVYYRLYCLHRF